MTKQTLYMWLKTLDIALFPGALFYVFYLLEWMHPKPGFEYVFDTFFFGAAITFLSAITITIAALFYNAFKAYQKDKK